MSICFRKPCTSSVVIIGLFYIVGGSIFGSREQIEKNQNQNQNHDHPPDQWEQKHSAKERENDSDTTKAELNNVDQLKQAVMSKVRQPQRKFYPVWDEKDGDKSSNEATTQPPDVLTNGDDKDKDTSKSPDSNGNGTSESDNNATKKKEIAARSLHQSELNLMSLQDEKDELASQETDLKDEYTSLKEQENELESQKEGVESEIKDIQKKIQEEKVTLDVNNKDKDSKTQSGHNSNSKSDSNDSTTTNSTANLILTQTNQLLSLSSTKKDIETSLSDVEERKVEVSMETEQVQDLEGDIEEAIKETEKKVEKQEKIVEKLNEEGVDKQLSGKTSEKSDGDSEQDTTTTSTSSTTSSAQDTPVPSESSDKSDSITKSKDSDDSVITKVESAITSTVNTVVDTAKDTKDAVVNGVVDKVNNVVDGVVSGVENVVLAPVNAVNDVVDKVITATVGSGSNGTESDIATTTTEPSSSDTTSTTTSTSTNTGAPALSFFQTGLKVNNKRRSVSEPNVYDDEGSEGIPFGIESTQFLPPTPDTPPKKADEDMIENYLMHPAEIVPLSNLFPVPRKKALKALRKKGQNVNEKDHSLETLESPVKESKSDSESNIDVTVSHDSNDFKGSTSTVTVNKGSNLSTVKSNAKNFNKYSYINIPWLNEFESRLSLSRKTEVQVRAVSESDTSDDKYQYDSSHLNSIQTSKSNSISDYKHREFPYSQYILDTYCASQGGYNYFTNTSTLDNFNENFNTDNHNANTDSEQTSESKFTFDRTQAVGTSQLPVLQIFAKPFFEADYHWVNRVCTASSGTPCSKERTWATENALLCIDGTFFSFAKIHTRGHVSALMPKHQYSISLIDSRGKKVYNKSFLGLPPSEDSNKWILAMSFVDTTFMRNQLSFELYRRLGAWAPRTRYVNLLFQGQRLGLYSLVERIEVAENRVSLEDENSSQPNDPNLNFLVTVDWPKPGSFSFFTNYTKTSLAVVHPKKESKLSQYQKDYIVEFMNKVDKRLLLSDSNKGSGSISDLIDLPSFARYFILQEIAKDMDGYGLSDYLKIVNNKLYHAGPWDFDLAYNFVCLPSYWISIQDGKYYPYNTGWNVENPRYFAEWQGLDGSPSGGFVDFGRNLRIFFYHLWKNEEFNSEFRKMWRHVRGVEENKNGYGNRNLGEVEKKDAKLNSELTKLEEKAQQQDNINKSKSNSNYYNTVTITGKDNDGDDVYFSSHYPLFSSLQNLYKSPSSPIDLFQSAMQSESPKLDLQIWSKSNNRCAYWECCNVGDSMDYVQATENLRMYLKSRGEWMDERVEGMEEEEERKAKQEKEETRRSRRKDLNTKRDEKSEDGVLLTSEIMLLEKRSDSESERRDTGAGGTESYGILSYISNLVCPGAMMLMLFMMRKHLSEVL